VFFYATSLAIIPKKDLALIGNKHLIENRPNCKRLIRNCLKTEKTVLECNENFQIKEYFCPKNLANLRQDISFIHKLIPQF
jgi:hypothetical protein